VHAKPSKENKIKIRDENELIRRVYEAQKKRRRKKQKR